MRDYWPNLQSCPPEIDLGDDYTLVHYGGGTFKILQPYWLPGERIVGGLHVIRGYDPGMGDEPRLRGQGKSTVPSLNDIWLADHVRKMGLGRRAVKALLPYIKALRSDSMGRTSDQAAKMWKSLGSRSLTYDDEPEFGNSWYGLKAEGFSRLLKAVLFESVEPTKIPLPSGNWLQLCNDPDKHNDLWSLFDATGDEIGYFSVWARDGQGRPMTVPSMDDSQLYTHGRGKGHGREAMQGLTIYYKTLRSSASGATSLPAAKAWMAINAKELTPAERKYKSYLQNSDWMLSADDVDWRVEV